MSHLSFTQLNSFLSFSKLHLLVFSPQWKLTGLHPNHRSFLGWDEGDFRSYLFEDNFLKPNALDLSSFLGQFQQKNHLAKNYFWRDAEGHVNGPFETYFRLRRDDHHLKTIMAFVRLDHGSEKLEIDPKEKSKIFLAEPLSGLLQNLSGPLDSMFERLEILKKKSNDTDDFNELIALTRQLQDSLKTLRYKVNNERQLKPVFINLNEFIRQELQFLQLDHFFKQRIKVNVKMDHRIQKTSLTYTALSGILAEFYYYLRGFVCEDTQYTLQAETFLDYERQGFHLNFLGEFQIPPELSVRFPIDLEGEARQIALQTIEGLDVIYLAYCLEKISGHLELSGRKNMMKLNLIFPSIKE